VVDARVTTALAALLLATFVAKAEDADAFKCPMMPPPIAWTSGEEQCWSMESDQEGSALVRQEDRRSARPKEESK
jgi:hypothetical protein